ncbi:alpha-ribazole kinase [Alkalithermobacter thermoalcaliphilus JW-YL-7 = DSM 7308]|uniref:Alpha-ribazole kinase n=1 Tax=Alkalithermobacter thermoalcaliphilus JW-YL-7 = DSM 7308 TaxID=1121328 RepID=A0A150FPB6_CLOPD|nr:hypothetical protein JWYL7_1892 [[Clostridium] paradoxum JW-YL-7 = DSM 7308]SHL21206.1 alpha-ribazole kinase [[Clostridium] paradoxum JW-YL-7 = DSM 7308]
MKVEKIRDLTLVSIDNQNKMVISCDSCGSIGLKSGDVFKVDPFYVGRFTARVALLEVLCSGANIVCITNAICNEMNPTGKQIIKGIKEELKLLDLDDVVLTGSTEENFITTSTGLGVTVIGIAKEDKIKVNNIDCSCILVSIGIPKVGNEIDLDNDIQIASYKTLDKLLNTQGILEIVPVGSKGIMYECEQLAINNGLNLQIYENSNIDLYKSAGPATVLVAAVKDNCLKDIKDIENLNVIGRLIKGEK